MKRWIVPRSDREGALERLALVTLLGIGWTLRGFQLDRVPLGLLWDEAYNASDAVQILHGARPIFLTGNFGREAMLMYFQAASISVLGQTDLAMRLPSALAGMLTLPVSYVLVRRLFDRRVALLTLGWLALSPWHVILSRLALRPILLPLVCALAFYALWRGLEAFRPAVAAPPDRRAPVLTGLAWLALAGALVGLSLYTYVAARFVPLVVLAFAAHLLAWDTRWLRRAWPGFLACGVAATLVFAPEGMFFARHPDAFLTRARAVSPLLDPSTSPGAAALALAHTALRSLGVFSIAGDTNWAWSVSGQPIFDPISSALLVLGLLLAVRRRRDPAHALLLTWIVVMLVPALLTDREVPNNLRVSGVAPAIFVLPALGADWLWDLAQRRGAPSWRRAPLAVAGLAVVAGTAFATVDYFGIWAHAPDVSSLYGADRWIAIQTGERLSSGAGAPVLVGAGDADGPLQSFLLSRRPSGKPPRLFDGTTSLVFPPEPDGATYVFADRDRPPATLLARFFPGQAGDVVSATPGGQPILRFQLPADHPIATPSRRLPARFGDQIQALGFDVPGDVAAGQNLTVRWYWRLLTRDPREWYFFNQLFDATNRRWGQTDGRPFMPDYWPLGTSGVSTFDVKVDPNAETGAYWLDEGVYDRADLSRLTVYDEQGRPAGGRVRLGPIKVHGRPRPAPRVQHPLLAHFGDQIDLVGAGLDGSSLAPGQTATLALYWRARGRPGRDYTVFVQLVDAAGTIRAQGDGPPDRGGYPTSVWDDGEVIADPHALALESSTPRGRYHVLVGLYAPETGRRLPLLDDAGQIVGDHVTLDVTVGEPAAGTPGGR